MAAFDAEHDALDRDGTPPEVVGSAPSRRTVPAWLTRHWHWLGQVVFARVRCAHEADDVLQEVATAATQAEKRPVEDRLLGPWLHRVAINALRQRHRQRTREQAAFARLANETDLAEPQATEDPAEWLCRQERTQLIRTALGNLPEEDAELLLLKYSTGWTYRQLATHYETSQAALEARLHRARKRLRRALLQDANARAVVVPEHIATQTTD